MSKKFLFSTFQVWDSTFGTYKGVFVLTTGEVTVEAAVAKFKADGVAKWPIVCPVIPKQERENYLKQLVRQATAAFHQQNTDFAL